EDDLEEDPADYPADGKDDDEEEASEEDENEEEEHLALADSAALPAIDHVPSAEETEPFKTNKYATTPPPPRSPQTRPPMAASTEALIAENASAPTLPSPPPSPLSPLSSPLPRIPSPPLLLPPPHTSLTYASAPLGYRAAIIGFKTMESSTAAAAKQTGHTLALRVDYGFIDTMDASIRASKSRVMTAVEEVNKRVTDLATTQRQDAHELYVRNEDAWSRSKDRSTALEAFIRAQEARITALEAQTRALFRELARTRDAGHQDGPADAGSSC
ncbi:hypothetical protein Tco_0496271, partial [Tanacetum coccineum]